MLTRLLVTIINSVQGRMRSNASQVDPATEALPHLQRQPHHPTWILSPARHVTLVRQTRLLDKNLASISAPPHIQEL